MNTCSQTLEEISTIPVSLTRRRLCHPCGDEAVESSVWPVTQQYTVTRGFHSLEASPTPNSNSSYYEYNSHSVVSKKVDFTASLSISCYPLQRDAPLTKAESNTNPWVQSKILRRQFATMSRNYFWHKEPMQDILYIIQRGLDAELNTEWGQWKPEGQGTQAQSQWPMRKKLKVSLEEG